MKRLLTSAKFLTTFLFGGLFLAWASAGRLRYGSPFRNFFPQTCIVMPDEEVVPTLVVFLFGLGSAIACFVALFRSSAKFRQAVLGIVVLLITFSVGVYINAAI